MKMQKLTLVLLALMGIFILSGCEKKDEAPQPTQNIVQLAQDQLNLSSLVTALVNVFATNGVIHTINKVLLPSGK